MAEARVQSKPTETSRMRLPETPLPKDAAMPFTPPAAFTTRPTLEGHFGMAASTHWLATAASQAVLERGGNAFDAAVAGAFLLHVVEPHLNGPGGDMTGIFATAEEPSRPQVMMGQGPAPAAATIENYRSEGLDMVPGAGALAAAVPGAVDAWLGLLEHHGTGVLDEVLDIAIGYSCHGPPSRSALRRRHGRRRRLARPARAPRHVGIGRRPRLRHRLCGQRAPDPRAGGGHDREGQRAVHRALAELSRPLDARGQGPCRRG